MRIIIGGVECQSCTETVSREDEFCPRCGARQPWMPRAWHMAVVAVIAIVGSGAVAAPQWLVDWLGF